MKNYKGFDYVITDKSYSVYDYGKLTDQKICIAGGSGINDPEQRAIEVIDDIIKVIEVNKKC